MWGSEIRLSRLRRAPPQREVTDGSRGFSGAGESVNDRSLQKHSFDANCGTATPRASVRWSRRTEQGEKETIFEWTGRHGGESSGSLAKSSRAHGTRPKYLAESAGSETSRLALETLAERTLGNALHVHLTQFAVRVQRVPISYSRAHSVT